MVPLKVQCPLPTNKIGAVSAGGTHLDNESTNVQSIYRGIFNNYTLVIADAAALSFEHARVASLVAAVVDQPTLLGVVERVAAARAEV